MRTAVVIDELVTHDGLFDMRFLAAIYLLIYILLLIPMLSKLLGRVKVYSEGLFIAVFAVLIFGDTAMITRFASFYTQPIELILMVALANCVLQIPDSLNRFLPQIGLAVTVILMMAVNQYCALMGVVFSVAYWMLTKRMRFIRGCICSLQCCCASSASCRRAICSTIRRLTRSTTK